MKTFMLTLLTFATVFSLSSGFSRNARNDGHEALVEPNEANGGSLQKKKPPGNVPGPKLTAEEQIVRFFPGAFAHEEKPKKHLTDRDKGRKKDLASLEKNKHKDKSLGHAAESRQNRKEEETQEERIDSV